VINVKKKWWYSVSF